MRTPAIHRVRLETRRVLVLCILAVLPGAVFASGAHAAKIDSCELLTAADLQSQFGLPFSPPEEMGSTASCAYYSTPSLINARLTIFTEPNVKSAKQQLKFKSKPQPVSNGSTRKSKKVKGLGDDARYFPLTSTGSQSWISPVLLVRAGKIIVELVVDQQDADYSHIDAKPATLALAKLILDRL